MRTFLVLLLASVGVSAQDFYDPAVLRQVSLTFAESNWEALLRANYASETLLRGDMVIDGVSYPNVGVRIRGNTSYTALPANSQKFSLKVETDFIDPDQDVMGYNNLNFNNGWRDPTFTRELVFNNFVAQYVPNPRASHVVVSINGQNWGVYINVQQPNKDLLREWFSDNDGLRIRCANVPNGPGLIFNGNTAAGYPVYDIQESGGFADPYQPLIAVANALTNEPAATWQNIDNVFALDPSIWAVVLENLLTDDDSYVNKGCDFMTYRDPVDGRMHLFPRDANETFSAPAWTIDRNFTLTNRPFLRRINTIPELKQRFMAHYRHARSRLNWTTFEPLFTAQRNLIDAAVQADTKKLYSYTLFQQNFTQTVNMPLPGLAGGNIVGLQQFVDSRAATLAGSSTAVLQELNAQGPTIANAQASLTNPAPVQSVFVTAAVAANGNPIASVWLYVRPSAAVGVYTRRAMLDDGLNGDGAAGDGVYGAPLLTLPAINGQRVAWYVGAVAQNAFSATSFLPIRTERNPNFVEYFAGDANGLRITEWMYAGAAGEFIELTNLSDAAIDTAGYSIDDSNATAGTFPIGAFGVVAPGESVIITEADASAFRTAWNLPAGVKIIGGLGSVGSGGNNLGRNDQIHLYNGSNALIDRLFFGDQTFSGTIRTQNRSGQTQCANVGQNNVTLWVLSTAGDVFGSVTASGGDVGSPGIYLASCGLFANGFE